MRDFYEVIMYIREFNSGITICIEILRETNKFHELQHQATFGVSLTVGVHFPRYPVKCIPGKTHIIEGFARVCMKTTVRANVL